MNYIGVAITFAAVFAIGVAVGIAVPKPSPSYPARFATLSSLPPGSCASYRDGSYVVWPARGATCFAADEPTASAGTK